jgi:hypothetical protein
MIPLLSFLSADAVVATAADPGAGSVQDIARFVLAHRRVASMLHAPPQGVTK